MKIYLSGRITPLPKWFFKIFTKWGERRQERNITRFNAKATELRALGHKVFNPVDGEPDGVSLAVLYADDLLRGFVKFKPEIVYVMKGWEGSFGVELEIAWAELHDIRIIYES